MSTLSQSLDDYLKLRRALGFKLRDAEWCLRGFLGFLEDEGAKRITTELALMWARRPINGEPFTWAQRLRHIRLFAAWYRARDAHTEVPDAGLLTASVRRKPPFIFSEEQIADIIREAEKLPCSRGMRSSTFSTMFGLLAVAGLRISEAIALDRGDVDLQTGQLTVRNTKFGKTRLVPLSKSTIAALRRYAEQRDQTLPVATTPAFFVSERGWRHRLGHAVQFREGVARRRAARDRASRGPARWRPSMSVATLPSLLQSFFTERLLAQRRASSHTVASYRDCFRLLLGFATKRLGKQPSALTLDDLDAPLISKFLDYLERDRGNSARSRNVRLAALHSFFRYVAMNEPAHLLHCQRVLAIPNKRYERKPVGFLDEEDVAALLKVPDLATWIGRRDRALLLVATQTGLRVSELVALRREDISLGTGAHVRCRGKGRKQRATPLLKDAVSVLKSWVAENEGPPSAPLFPSSRGGPLSRDAVEALLKRHLASACEQRPSLKTKRATPHTLRHSRAMSLLQHGVDRSVIALWLGHESVETTQIYLHADMGLKEKALAHTTPTKQKPARYRPGDKLLAFLEGL